VSGVCDVLIGTPEALPTLAIVPVLIASLVDWRSIALLGTTRGAVLSRIARKMRSCTLLAKFAPTVREVGMTWFLELPHLPRYLSSRRRVEKEEEKR